MMYRLIQDWGGLPEGSVISEEKFLKVSYLDKVLFESLNEFEERDLIEYKDEKFCIEHGIDKLLFYTENELQIFLEKKK